MPRGGVWKVVEPVASLMGREGSRPGRDPRLGRDSRLSRWPEGTPPDERLEEALELLRGALGDDPTPGLEAVARLRPLLDAWEEEQVYRARDEGWNWAEIAKQLGRHRQAVHREYARRTRRDPGQARQDTA